MDKWYVMHAIIDAFKKCKFDGNIAIWYHNDDEISISIDDSECALGIKQVINIQQLGQLNGESKILVNMHIRVIVEGMITLINERKIAND